MRTSRSYRSIVRANTLTIPNGILFVFVVLTIGFGSWKDALFVGILVANIAIGSFQEIRSKRALDRLAALVAPQAMVVRDGVDGSLSPDQVVVGDLVRLAAGDQVVADGMVVSADGLAVDESNLTGESESVVRGSGEEVWSGSFTVEGAGLFEATAVGADSRAGRLTATARAFRHARSPLERATTGSSSCSSRSPSRWRSRSSSPPSRASTPRMPACSLSPPGSSTSSPRD